MAKDKFQGTGVALITPFKADGTVDYGALEKLVKFNIENGVDYLVVLGTTGESVTLKNEEKRDVWRFVSETVDFKIPLVAGIGGNNTIEIDEALNIFNPEGYNAILSVSPYYNKPSQEGIYQHYQSVCNASPLPVIIYNVPGRTGSNISAETTLRLANSSNRFIGIKEASGNFAQIMQIVKNRPNNFLVISGDDMLTLPLLGSGCDGVISVVAQAFPKDFSNMVDEALKGDFDDAQKLHYKLLDFMEWFFAEGSPSGVKAALHILGICENILRLPLVPVSDKLYGEMKKAMGGG